ncbi:MAG: hypothetical protein R2847_08530 [Bacteroidia bacterium]
MYWVYMCIQKKASVIISDKHRMLSGWSVTNCGYEKSTSPYRPYKLVCKIEKPTRSEAMQLEKN